MAEEPTSSVESTVREIRRWTRKKYSAEEKVRTPALACGATVVLEGVRGEEKIAELCRREGIPQNMYYKWSKDFLEAGKQRLAGVRAAKQTARKWKRCAVRTSSSKRWSSGPNGFPGTALGAGVDGVSRPPRFKKSFSYRFLVGSESSLLLTY